MNKELKVNVDYVARVEGQGKIEIVVSGGQIKEARFPIFEPPKFYESFLVGRHCSEVHELTARICGICPVSHEITALRAVENALGIKVSQQTRDLRKLFAYSSHIMSHVLSIYILSLPDFLGHESVFSMTKDYGPVILRALKLKKLGNDMTELIGGRAVHPVSALINGFSRIPEKEEMNTLRKRLVDAKQDAKDTVELVSRLKIPEFTRECEQIAISQSDEYAINQGRLKSTQGIDADESEYRKYISESQVDYSWAKQSQVIGRQSFLVGPLARVNLNFGTMSHDTKKIAQEIGYQMPNFNPFNSIIARALEVVNAIDDSIAIINRLPLKEEDRSFDVKEGTGCAITEAARGILYHAYTFDKKGQITKADIVTPTAHNCRNIEYDFRQLVPTIADLPESEAKLRSEMLVRAYDPCISCSVHYTKLK